MMRFGIYKPYVRPSLTQIIMDCRVRPGNDNIEAPAMTKNRDTPMIEYADASAAVRAVYDDIKKTRNVPDVNNFWKYLARDPATLKRTWESIKEIMAPGALDPLTKEMVYLAVSVTNGCAYCIASHTAAARKAGMTEAMFGELMAVTGMANETNRLANGYRVPVDQAYLT